MSQLKYVPDKGDVIWLDLEPHIGREQAGLKPVLVLTPQHYNSRAELAVFCPITIKIKRYPYEVPVPEGFKVSGVILADQVKSLAWEERKAKFICKLPPVVLRDVIQKVYTLIF